MLHNTMATANVTGGKKEILEVLETLFSFDHDFNGLNGYDNSQRANEENEYESDLEFFADEHYMLCMESGGIVDLLERVVDAVWEEFKALNEDYYNLGTMYSKAKIGDSTIIFSVACCSR